MPFKCVPLNPEWVKLDIRAIYRRPTGDLTAALPLRRHADWLGKGFEYVTLADRESLQTVANNLRQRGEDPHSYVVGYDGGPWDLKLYMADQATKQAADDVELKGMIEQFGVEAVEKIRGEKVPAHLLPATEAAPVLVAADAPKVAKR